MQLPFVRLLGQRRRLFFGSLEPSRMGLPGSSQPPESALDPVRFA